MSASVLSIVSAINDAATVISALTPLVQQAMQNGDTEVSDEQLAAARAITTGSIQALDEAIAKARE